MYIVQYGIKSSTDWTEDRPELEFLKSLWGQGTEEE